MKALNLVYNISVIAYPLISTIFVFIGIQHLNSSYNDVPARACVAQIVPADPNKLATPVLHHTTIRASDVNVACSENSAICITPGHAEWLLRCKN